MEDSRVQSQKKLPNFFGWWLVDQPIQSWSLTVKITHSVLIFFSIPVLLKTLFAPWKRDIYTPKNASLDIVFKTVVDNFISRLIGFIVRFFTIIVGLLATGACFIALLAVMIFWLCVPVIILFILYKGVV